MKIFFTIGRKNAKTYQEIIFGDMVPLVWTFAFTLMTELMTGVQINKNILEI